MIKNIKNKLKKDKEIKNKLKREKKIKNKLKREEEIKNMVKNIKQNTNKIWLPTKNLSLKLIYNNSWFDIQKYENLKLKKKEVNLPIYKLKQKESLRNCQKIELLLNNKQKLILNHWFNAYTKMYNETLKYIKNEYKNNKKINTNFINIRKKLELTKKR